MGWLRDRRRQKILEHPFPAEWEQILAAGLSHWQHLDLDERSRLRCLTQVFVAEKSWEGCGGLHMTDEIRVTVAGQACLLLLGLENVEFTDVDSILVYPHAVKTPEGPHASYGSVVESGSLPILGQALSGGPVLLTWDAITKSARHPERGHNVVYHEFAHKLDMLDGAPDGAPPLPAAMRARWTRTMTSAYEDFCKRLDEVEAAIPRHVDPESPAADAWYERLPLDPYAATDPGEFFAVATEIFFTDPGALHDAYPALYALFRDYFGQDPLTAHAAPPPDPADRSQRSR